MATNPEAAKRQLEQTLAKLRREELKLIRQMASDTQQRLDALNTATAAPSRRSEHTRPRQQTLSFVLSDDDDEVVVVKEEPVEANTASKTGDSSLTGPAEDTQLVSNEEAAEDDDLESTIEVTRARGQSGQNSTVDHLQGGEHLSYSNMLLGAYLTDKFAPEDASPAAFSPPPQVTSDVAAGTRLVITPRGSTTSTLPRLFRAAHTRRLLSDSPEPMIVPRRDLPRKRSRNDNNSSQTQGQLFSGDVAATEESLLRGKKRRKLVSRRQLRRRDTNEAEAAPVDGFTSLSEYIGSSSDGETINDEHAINPPKLAIMKVIIRNLKNKKEGPPFTLPVDPVELKIPDYFAVIKTPMDLSTIERRLKSKAYKSISDFVADFNLIVTNCYEYNGSGHLLSRQAEKLKQSFDYQMRRLT
ncbi:transcription initiation at TATA-containing promoter protein [Cladophialophora chaetospira]|uniref:Transcription initiation at TATA-containing promoter protein n=1 Tax=Cladophialophora chaetospira TaxID=386627 RepID=A0AA38WZI8_9EURO|nr:transcription initiation at TATA-containing promoter protein [Cladophialophora chaetospira]